MDDELDTLARGDADLEKTLLLIGADEHGEITKVEHGSDSGGRATCSSHLRPRAGGHSPGSRDPCQQVILILPLCTPNGRRRW